MTAQSGKFEYILQPDGTAAIVRCLENARELHIPTQLPVKFVSEAPDFFN